MSGDSSTKRSTQHTRALQLTRFPRCAQQPDTPSGSASTRGTSPAATSVCPALNSRPLPPPGPESPPRARLTRLYPQGTSTSRSRAPRARREDRTTKSPPYLPSSFFFSRNGARVFFSRSGCTTERGRHGQRRAYVSGGRQVSCAGASESGAVRRRVRMLVRCVLVGAGRSHRACRPRFEHTECWLLCVLERALVGTRSVVVERSSNFCEGEAILRPRARCGRLVHKLQSRGTARV